MPWTIRCLDVDDDGKRVDADGVLGRHGETEVRCGGGGRRWLLLEAFRRWKESAVMIETMNENGKHVMSVWGIRMRMMVGEMR